MEFAVDHRTPSLSSPPPRPHVGHRSGPQHSEALRDVLAELGERVKPITLARERTLPVAAPFDQLLPDDGLVRGRVVSCRGAADTSLAFGLIAEALVEGAWAAVVDVATFGTDAASEFGIPLERVVRVESGVAEAERSADDGTVAAWIDVMGAAVDGFDVVVTKVPAELQRDVRPAAVRKLATRVQQKGAIVVVLGESGALGSDLVFSTERTEWNGVASGAGHLRSRVIDVAAGGRRLPAVRTVSILVEGVGGRAVCSPGPTAVPAPVPAPAPAPVVAPVGVAEADLVVDLAEYPSTERDPQAELLAEMTDNLAASDVSDAACSDAHRLAG